MWIDGVASSDGKPVQNLNELEFINGRLYDTIIA